MGQSIDADIFYTNKQTDKLLYIAKKNNIDCDKTVFLDIPYRFKNSELKHLETNIQSMPYKIYNNEIQNIDIFLAKNPYTEIEQIAKTIVKLVRNENYRYKDIAIITKQLNTYASLIKAIFSNYSIPVFMDENKELSQNEVAKFLLALLEIFASNWSYESVIQYMKTGFIDISNEEIYEFENYTKKWGIKGNKWYNQQFKFGKNDNEDEKQKAKAIKQAKKLLQREGLLPPDEPLAS